MSEPVTREVLREELAKHPTRNDLREELAQLREEFTRHPLRRELAEIREQTEAIAEWVAKRPPPTTEEMAPFHEFIEVLRKHPTDEERDKAYEKYATTIDLKGWGSALYGTIARLDAKVDARFDALIAEMRKIKIDLNLDLAQHVRASDEQHRSELKIIDEKYADLPERVAALEKR